MQYEENGKEKEVKWYSPGRPFGWGEYAASLPGSLDAGRFGYHRIKIGLTASPVALFFASQVLPDSQFPFT